MGDPPSGAAPGLALEPGPCPICGKPARAEAAPFCSKRCANVDLHRWLGGVYAVPDEEPPSHDMDDEGG